MNNNKLKNELNIILKNIDGNYGILISKKNEIIFEKYIENNKNTRFRIFSCSKLITGLAIILLVQMNLLNLHDTIDKFNINIPNNNKITIIHLLQHSSGVYDFTSKLYFELKSFDMFNNILNKYDTNFIEFNTMINEINKNKPYFKPLINPYKYHQDNYNNTGYDILGYIIFLVSNIKTNDFIKSNIFDKLNMKQSGFQHEKNKDESTPYDNNKNKAIK